MVEIEVSARRGSFHLDLACRFEKAWTVVFGPSGSGKSTLLRMIAGLDQPERGRIVIDGLVVLDTAGGVMVAPGGRGVGLAAQQPALFPHLSVDANVAYGLKGLPAEERRRRTAQMLALVDAAHLAGRVPRSLSGGEAQRVALARTLAPRPRLLLLDEPLSALGAEARDFILTRLKVWLQEFEIPLILVTHDAADALVTQAEVVLLAEGQLVAAGPAAEVLAKERERILSRLAVGPRSSG